MLMEQSEEMEEEVLAKEEEVRSLREEFPKQNLPELENVTQLEAPEGQMETAEEEEKG